ncbi:glycosyltransferase family 2 protein [uncultured Aliiroseovarius sp.]|uniref:glycosyltransferase family 2 protein n=1 Tax=uncultured Aliiroseovarius sp. TaxID=1658783 RepID=UPI002627CEB0|nr:glycosyltransferase family 2 protein [uncultured Aliiroseovarius sp.]
MENLHEGIDSQGPNNWTPKLSAVVPCYNEEEVFGELLKRLTAACAAVAGNDFEIVLVDDGSSDRTRALLRDAQQQDPRIVAVFLSRNHGHQLALTAGLSVARGERIFVLDADLQDPPELLGPMMSKMDEGYDVVYGKRKTRKGEGPFKQASARLFYRVMSGLVDFDIPLDTGDFRLISRRVADRLNEMPERHRFVRGMISWVGYPQTAMEYDRHERFAGETKYPLRKMLGFAVDAITSFSTVPLRIATWLGICIGVLSLLLIVRSLWVWAAGETVPGWTSLTLVVLLLGGVQMFTIGVIGEYLGRLYMQSKARPLFIIEEIVRGSEPQSVLSETEQRDREVLGEHTN